ncbi:hypothetical protein EMIT0158MI4_40153 [Burkholderia ambifaria]
MCDAACTRIDATPPERAGHVNRLENRI